MRGDATNHDRMPRPRATVFHSKLRRYERETEEREMHEQVKPVSVKFIIRNRYMHFFTGGDEEPFVWTDDIAYALEFDTLPEAIKAVESLGDDGDSLGVEVQMIECGYGD